MSLEQTNLEDILAFYFYGTNAHEALMELEHQIKADRDAWLKRMLRDYREEPVYDPDEIAFRDCVDDLMTFCNVAEIAAAGCLINMQPSRHWSWGPLERVLRNAHVENYYKNFYPDRLPQLLLRRIKGTHEATEKCKAKNLCLGFLELDRQFVKNHRNGYLLKLLDDFTIDHVRFLDVIGLLETPKRLLDSLFKPVAEKQITDEAVSELSQFLNFCNALKEQLNEMENYPLLQAEAWSRYAYWFEIIADKMKTRLGEALDQFIAWTPTEGGTLAIREIQSFVTVSKKTINYLCSPSHGAQVDALLARP